MSRDNPIEAIVRDVDRAIRANYAWDILNNGYVVSSADNIAQELYYAGYRKASEVAREVLSLVWDAYNSTHYDAEFEEMLDEIEKKYTEGGV